MWTSTFNKATSSVSQRSLLRRQTACGPIKITGFCLTSTAFYHNCTHLNRTLTRAETKDALDTLAFLSTIACFRYRSIPCNMVLYKLPKERQRKWILTEASIFLRLNVIYEKLTSHQCWSSSVLRFIILLKATKCWFSLAKEWELEL